MAAIDFPNAPANGDVFVAAGKTWVYDSTSLIWTLRSIPASIPDGAITDAKLALSESVLDGGTPTTLQFFVMGAVDAGILV